MSNRWITAGAVVVCAVFFVSILSAQPTSTQVRITGRILNGSEDSKPVGAGMVFFPEFNLKIRTSAEGRYSATLPGDGIYMVTITSPGLKMVRTKLEVKGDTDHDFVLYRPSAKGEVTVTTNRDIQKISRHTMTLKQLKEVPASFGDSLNALTSLPNVMRTDGLFGPMVIRGADPALNGYFIDNIPIYNPMHFGGIHSVINNNLMHEIDLYSSSFPVQFGDSQAAVININTVDEVERFGGFSDMGLISSAALIQKPIEEEYLDSNGDMKKKNKGYVIMSGRVGYLTLFFKAFGELYAKVFDKEAPSQLPYYGDYQFKVKYFLAPEHSLTFLAFGSYDYIDVSVPDDAVGDSGDPLWVGAQFRENTYAHGQGLTYAYNPNGAFKNSLLLYNSLMVSELKLAIERSPQPELADGVDIKSKPLICGIKENFSLDLIKNHLQLKGGTDLTYYYFTVGGTTFQATEQINEGEFDPAKDQVELIPLNKNVHNFTSAGYAETKATLGWLELVPGVRINHFYRRHDTMIDPRGRAALNFPTDTTLSAAAGKYSYLIQLSPSYFNMDPDLSRAEYLEPQQSYHTSAGLEQKIGNFSIKTEGFYNTFKNIVTTEEWDDNGTTRYYKNCAEAKSMGVECMLKLDQKEGENGFFGWLSYTFDKSKYKSGAEVSDPDEYDEWIDSNYELVHTFKLVLGYTINRHTFSTRFQCNTSAPYTPITGSELTLNPDGTTYVSPKGYNRYFPTYGATNSERYGVQHRLDLRYSYKQTYEWGYYSWYVEFINVTSFIPKTEQWDYRYPYSEGSNPTMEKSDSALAIIPNFGIEVKF